MDLWHVTPAVNKEPIEHMGLLIKCYQGKRPAVWLCNSKKLFWAWLHVARHHETAAEDMIAFPIELPRGWLQCWRHGIWLCLKDIPAARIGEPIVFHDIRGGDY
jgi:hypothetical protein